MILSKIFTSGQVPPEKYCREHPGVQMLLAQGWKFGTEPQPGEEYKH